MFSLLNCATHKALFSKVTCRTISNDWCHDRCQEESIDSAGFSIFNAVNGHLLSSDATAALFQMEAHVTPRLIMPATSREARALCPSLPSLEVRLQRMDRFNKCNIRLQCIRCKFGFDENHFLQLQIKRLTQIFKIQLVIQI